MLNRRQLEGAIECRKFYDCKYNTKKCGGIVSKRDLAQTALTLLNMLKRLEFSNLSWDGLECYICGGKNEHKEGCELAALLKESVGEEG